MKKVILALLLSTAILAACGNTEKETKNSSTAESTVVSKESEESTEESTEETTEESKTTKKSATSAPSKRAETMKEYIEAQEMELLYAQSEPTIVEMGDFEVSVDEYELVKVTDFDSNFKIPFGDQTDEGGIILATISIANTSDKTLYYPSIPDLTFTGATKAYTNNRTVVEDNADDSDNMGAIVVDTKGEIKAGETQTMTVNYLFSDEALSAILDLGLVTMQVPHGYTKAESFKSEDKVGDKQNIQLSVSSDGEKTASDNASFLQDKVSTDDMGTKTLDMEKKDINTTQSVDGVDAILSEYQFTFFEPNEVEAERFSNFENGTVLLTVKFVLDNKGEKTISMSSSSATLRVNNDSQRVLSEGMLTNYTTDVVSPGEKKDLLQVFVLDQEQYEKIWREKDFSINLNLVDGETFKRETVEFDLPK
ncbi:DUF5068 domain-containing protein [Candidatus Enterococcus clewellii]|uniref:DUF5068 domain-containing protein n=1 Tax=Candidatus Enterococcus clewellii TaxID=1834193 RepID=A0A242K576_9ENTE|nr:DUF5068 domain-containing protein [Enterococcus sp. 9E7_DIV0242]OTP14482.1 hypothetical protein A5888_002583 [Enterococcus sp. 9E7_DIV0242]